MKPENNAIALHNTPPSIKNTVYLFNSENLAQKFHLLSATSIIYSGSYTSKVRQNSISSGFPVLRMYLIEPRIAILLSNAISAVGIAI
jgi:hypothetical protein